MILRFRNIIQLSFLSFAFFLTCPGCVNYVPPKDIGNFSAKSIKTLKNQKITNDTNDQQQKDKMFLFNFSGTLTISVSGIPPYPLTGKIKINAAKKDVKVELLKFQDVSYIDLSRASCAEVNVTEKDFRFRFVDAALLPIFTDLVPEQYKPIVVVEAPVPTELTFSGRFKEGDKFAGDLAVQFFEHPLLGGQGGFVKASYEGIVSIEK